MVPSQRGLGVTIKRGWKGRSARPNAPGVHINIEHVGVISCEPQQLASEVPMRKTVGLVEAPLGSPWSRALIKADCKELMDLLEENPGLVRQKVKGGFTVLHAAAMRGCLKLLDQVFDLFQGEVNGRFVDEREGIELSLRELCEAKGIYIGRYEEGISAAGLTAAEFAWWSMGNCDARIYLKDGSRSFPLRLSSNTFSSYQSEIFGSSIDSDSDSDFDFDEENPSPRTLLLEVLAAADQLSLLTAGMCVAFAADLNYNFVADYDELLFHHACQSLDRDRTLDMDSVQYVEAVIGGCVKKGRHVLKYLFQLRNAQGKTPLHVAVDSNYVHVLVGLIPGRESGENAECLNMHDSKGWTPLHYASADSLLNGRQMLGELLEDGRADVNARVVFRKRYSSDCAGSTPLHLAVIHNSWKAVDRLLQDPRIDVNALFHRRIYFDDSLYVNGFGRELEEWTTLQLAAVEGLPWMVKVLLTCPQVFICFHDQGHIQFSHKFYTLNFFVNALIILEPKNIQNERLRVIEPYVGHGIEYGTHGYLYKCLFKIHR